MSVYTNLFVHFLQVGAEELAPDDYKAASELRIRLATAAKVKQQLDVSLKCLTTTGPAHKEGQQSGQLTQQVEAAIEEAKWYLQAVMSPCFCQPQALPKLLTCTDAALLCLA